MSNNSNKLVIIDGNSIFYRSFYALPLLTNSNGEYSNAIYGFAMQIISIISNIKPTHIVVAFDAGKHTFRNDIYGEYKATRKPMPNELKSQLLPLKKMLELMKIKCVEQLGIEGDDIIGIISKKFPNTENIIITGDRDSFQLIDENTQVFFTKKGTSELKVMNLESLKEEYSVTPKLFIDLKALQGDTADNIPGVDGIGQKTATDLILKYGELENIFEHIDEIKGKTKEKLVAGKDIAFLSRKLATILTTGDIELNIDDCKLNFPFSNEVFEFFKNYEFKTLLKNKDIFSAETPAENVETIETFNISSENEFFELISKIKDTKIFAFYFQEEKVSISIENTEFVINISKNLLCENSFSEDFIFENLKPLFESNEILKICFNSKNDMYTLKNFNSTLKNYFDISIAKYLVSGVPVTKIEDVFISENPTHVASFLFCQYVELKEKIESENLNFLFYNVETPLSNILFSMENEGFKVDTNVLFELKEKYSSELKLLEEEIYKNSGEEFNINSPKQLAVILFEKLGLPHGKKISTSAETLEEISGLHPIINLILRYRKVAKFLGTYIDGLLPHIDKNNFVHTSFNQTLTTTGRLSSTEPNLQNIPIRSVESREIRSMFVAKNDDHILIDADYSQIELRLLAHCSEDEIFVDAFNNNVDIHTKTASEVFGVDKNSITPEMRRTAKVVNFGIIYGISDFGLAEDLKISPKQAKYFIENFYLSHPKVKNFMEEQIQNAKKTGKAITIFGRTRKMVDINASNFMVRSRAERAAQNMPLQGSAADIIKIAMVNTYNALKNENLEAKLIMQVHDELIVDAPKSEEERVKNLLKREMENAAKLKVPLEIDIKSSFRWSDGH